ncbi:50S ribosomal protein L24e [Candidatus Woesearchaeota archaeon CG_4_10_14_0_8_um_filter_47_5]|nr:MAG: 50S ribosomal protein L24e [Candidatus Woesearchaeota archaeon CG_4_10_14_0_8_um_filter_47_5]
MSNCSFCGNNIERGTGLMFVRTTGKILYFCSSKCEKNMLKLGRKPALVKWTATHRKAESSKSSKG